MEQSKKPSMFSAFKHYNYKLWFAGQAVSLIGSWMQMIAQGIFVYELTNDSAYLGLVAFASGIPTLIFSLFGGLVADRFSKRDLMVVTQTAMMILAFILSWLAFSHLVQPWMIVVLSFLLGVANAFDAPARMAFTVEMVGKEDLGNAIAMNSLMFNLGTAVGPAVSGVVYALFGPGWCFFINGLSFIFIIIALFMMRLPKHIKKMRTGSSWTEIVDGVRYTFKHDVIRTIIVNVGLVTIFAFSFMTLMPAWPSKAFGIANVDAAAIINGTLQSLRGVGAVLAGFVAAYFGAMSIKGKLMFWSQMLFPLLLIGFAVSTIMPVSYILLFLVGFAMLLFYNMNMVLVQTHVDDHYRGRVMSIYNIAFMGLIPIGGLLIGGAAKLFGEQNTVLVFGIITMVFGIFIHMRSSRLRVLQ
jgi:MFS family permease